MKRELGIAYCGLASVSAANTLLARGAEKTAVRIKRIVKTTAAAAKRALKAAGNVRRFPAKTAC